MKKKGGIRVIEKKVVREDNRITHESLKYLLSSRVVAVEVPQDEEIFGKRGY